MLKISSPVRVGPYVLKHRVVMAPLTRMRADAGDVPNELMARYYGQRASDGGLIIAEATSVSPRGRAYFGAAGIYSDAQAEGWKRVTRGVHAKGAKIFLQLWHGGRQSHPDNEPGNGTPVAPSAVRAEGGMAHTPEGWKPTPVPRALEVNEIANVVDEFRNAAQRALNAGFDGVEIHAANGYLLDQFLQTGSNRRTDAYGGSAENRARLLLEVVDAVTAVVGHARVGVRIGPSGSFGDMQDDNPMETFGYVARALDDLNVAYLHVIEPRVAGNETLDENRPVIAAKTIRKIFHGTLIAAGGFTADSAEDVLEEGTADLVAFGRDFISNPDLPERIYLGLPLNRYDRDTFYAGGAKGYTDYPSYREVGVSERVAA